MKTYTQYFEVEHFNPFGEWTPLAVHYACRDKPDTAAARLELESAYERAALSAKGAQAMGKVTRIISHTLTHESRVREETMHGQHSVNICDSYCRSEKG